MVTKRPSEGEEEMSRKRLSPSEFCKSLEVFKFQVLLPNGTSVDVKFHRSGTGGHTPLREFVHFLKVEYYSEPSKFSNQTRRIQWDNEDLYLVDAFEKKIRGELDFSYFRPNICHLLRLNDGSAEARTYENMWDLTPHTDLLRELPEEYTLETALADLIDNSLQAVWSNDQTERKLISVNIAEQRIEIFDTGPGMDGSPENSIVKWGKIGASLHRLAREHGIGTKPPYLTPFFGMFGFGGTIAAMHLGRRALVYSKTKQSKKVYKLHLEREALISSNSEHTWRANGGLRDPKIGETVEAPHGSFTKVRIFDPRLKGVNIGQLQCRLKDIYFPYIQCDELSRTGKTRKPIEFQVNGMDVAEVLGGEVAVTNMHSSNGPEFVLQLQFTTNQNVSSSSHGRASQEANARLRCVYFPIIKGRESIGSILEKLKEDGCGITEDFKSFSRVSVRRLGRLLPDARWAWLPFMEPRVKKGEKAQILKRCCYRVKCFIDTDGGFNPTPSKTDLAHQNPFTIALKGFGKKDINKEKDICVEITKDGRELALSELEKLYEDWISHMHDHYDEEMVTGSDEPVFVIGPANKKDLGISSEVIRVHKLFWRKEAFWKSGQKVKILKGAYTGFHKTNTYATLEYIILEGFQGDAGSEARLICRPIGVPDENGCVITEDKGSPSIRLGSSVSLPINVIDSDKFIAIEDAVWQKQIRKRNMIIPSSTEISGANDCPELVTGGMHQMTHEMVLSQSSEGNTLLCKEAIKLEPYVDDAHESAEKSIILQSAPSHSGNPTTSLAADHHMVVETLKNLGVEELEDELKQCGLCIKEHEMQIQSIQLKRVKIEQDIANLKDCVDLDSGHDLDCAPDKELVMNRIVSKIDSAAAVMCRFFRSPTFDETEWSFANNIMGVVACLGSVPTNDLSRVLALYLGEDQMLGIVCNTYAEASHLEKHESDGSINYACGLHGLAAKLGMSIQKHYQVFALENIRPYTGKLSNDSERKLMLPDPLLPSGTPLPGFMGYAVNMVDLDAGFQKWRTASGHGLRETLLYRLFGELQVYQNRRYLDSASSYIKDSAVSLDGGIWRGNGVLFQGYCNREVDVQFPVAPIVSPRVSEIRKQIDGKKEELKEMNEEINREQNKLQEVMNKYQIAEGKYEGALDKIENTFGEPPPVGLLDL